MEAHDINHRDISGGGARAAVFGISDGLLSNVSLILGVAGAHPGSKTIIIAGLAGLVAGAFSMGIGELISMGAQRELFERELRLEARELEERPDAETRELAQIYMERGLPNELAREVATYLMKDPKTALQVHAQEELGVSPDSIGSPIEASLASFFAFAVGALVPLVSWFFLSGTTAILASVGFSALATIAVGGGLALLTGRNVAKSALRQLVLSATAAAITYSIGHLLGTAIH